MSDGRSDPKRDVISRDYMSWPQRNREGWYETLSCLHQLYAGPHRSKRPYATYRRCAECTMRANERAQMSIE